MSTYDLIFLLVVLTGPVDMGGEEPVQLLPIPFPTYTDCSQAKVVLNTDKEARAGLDAELRQHLGEGLQSVRGCFDYEDTIEELEVYE